jgi:hypothetical protein
MTAPTAPRDVVDALRAARAPLRATRRALALAAAARATLWGAAAGCTVLALGALARAPAGGGPAVAAALVTGVLVTGIVGAMSMRGGRRAWTGASIALWLEARLPALRYALVTLADDEAGALPAPVARALAERVRATPWRAVVGRDVRRALTAPALALLAAIALSVAAFALAPQLRSTASVAAAARAPGPVAASTRSVDPLARVRVTVVPPGYSGERARTFDAPPAVAALIGSRLTIEGTGDPARVRAALVAPDGVAGAPDAAPPAELRVSADGARWRVALPMPVRPALLRLEARADTGTATARTRLVALEPRPDLTPRVALRAPARDSVLREGRGAIALRAAVDDDLGLADGAFEYIVSSGEGESFTFRAGRVGAALLGGARSAALAGALDLATLQLKPGDVVHLRAVARDRRPGPRVPATIDTATVRSAATPPPRPDEALGVSETRTLRIARAGEYDSVAVEGAPPPAVDTTAIGQRMILQLTEALVARAGSRRSPLPRATVVSESRKLASDQARLRRRVGDAVFARIGENEGEHAHFEGDGHQHGQSERLPVLTPEQLLAAADRATNSAGAAATPEAGESPVLAVNKPLLEAYNHMWDAGRALEIAEPRQALAPMRKAIAALQRARAAERIYLRGRPPAVVVDLVKVRGAGRVSGDTLRPAARTPRSALDPAARARAATLDRALALLAPGGDAAAATDSLAVLRVARSATPRRWPPRSARRWPRSRPAAMRRRH